VRLGVVGLSFLAACSAAPTTTTIGVIVPADAAPLVGEILADGTVTAEEFAMVVEATADCMRQAGVTVNGVYVDDDGSYGWTIGPGQGSDVVQATCRARFVGPIVEARAVAG